jgi:hypothetical protein
LKTELSRKVGLPTGPVLKVYGSDKKQVKALEDFVDGERYICTGAERLDEAGSKQREERREGREREGEGGKGRERGKGEKGRVKD